MYSNVPKTSQTFSKLNSTFNIKKHVFKEVGSNFNKKYQVLNFLPDDKYIYSGLGKKKLAQFTELTFLLVVHLCVGGGYMRYQFWISTNDALSGQHVHRLFHLGVHVPFYLHFWGCNVPSNSSFGGTKKMNCIFSTQGCAPCCFL